MPRLSVLMTALVLGWAGLSTPSAWAQTKPRVAVPRFTGKKARKVQRAVIKALKRQGFKVVTGRALRGRGRPPSDAKARQAISEAKELTAWVDGSIGRQSKKWTLVLVVTNGIDQRQVDARAVSARSIKSLIRRVKKKSIPDLKPILRSCKAPGSEPVVAKKPKTPEEASLEAVFATPGENAIEPPTKEPTPDPVPSAPVRTPITPKSKPNGTEPADEDTDLQSSSIEAMAPVEKEPGATSLRIAPSVRILSRQMTFNSDRVDPGTRYELRVAPAIGLDLAWYPLAHVTNGALAHIGFEGHGSYAIGVQSSNVSTNQGQTIAFDASGALKVRLPLGPVEFGLLGGFGIQRFQLNDIDDFPDVDYQFIQTGLDSRIHLTNRLSIQLKGLWLQVLDAGQVTQVNWLNGAISAGLDATAAVGYSLGAGLQLVARVDFRQFAFAENGAIAHPFATAGTDRYLSGALGLTWALPGASSGS